MATITVEIRHEYGDGWSLVLVDWNGNISDCPLCGSRIGSGLSWAHETTIAFDIPKESEFYRAHFQTCTKRKEPH